MTPTQVARHANCTPQSIRNWSREYADLLSPAASGQTGPRLYTDEDAEILSLIAALRKSGVSRDETRQRILNRDVAPPVVDAANEAKPGLNEALTAQEIQSGVQGVYMALQAQIDGLARRVEAQQHDALWWGRLQGVWIGIVLMAAIFFAVWLAVNGGM